MGSLKHKAFMAVALLLASGACSVIYHESAHASALRALCSALPSSMRDLEAVTETANISQLHALRMALDPTPLESDEIVQIDAVERDFMKSYRSMTVTIPADTQCRLRAAKPSRVYGDAFRVEVSNIFPANLVGNPTKGIFARVSLGGAPGADYFWIPLTDSGRAGEPVKLSADEG